MIAIVYPQFYGVGGIARYLDSFLACLPPEHLPIYLITGDELQQSRHYPNVKIIHLPLHSNRGSLLIWSLKARKLLKQMYIEKKIKWINLHFPPLIPTLFLPRHIPVVVTAHSTYLGMSKNYYQAGISKKIQDYILLHIKSWMEHRIFNLASKVITLTEQGKQEVLAYGFKKSITIIPNGTNLKNFSPDETIEKDIDVLFCGRIELGKGSREMVDVCHRLIIKKSDIKICIVGYGDDEAWVKKALSHYSQNIIMTGKVSFSAIPSYYNRSRIYVSTSFYEGLPGTCLEAMAMQLPSVVWNFLFYRGLVIEGETGFLLTPSETTLMTNKILVLLENPQDSKIIGKNARALLEKKYNWKKLAQEILDVFEK